MKRLKRHRGITLVEVLVSLILIGVIAAGFLTFFSGSFNNILRQRSQNAINFDIQESFEKQLAESKKHEGTGTDIETFTYQIGNGTKQSIDVKVQICLIMIESKKSIFLLLMQSKPRWDFLI